jgi:hypothetical protein
MKKAGRMNKNQYAIQSSFWYQYNKNNTEQAIFCENPIYKGLIKGFPAVLP